VDVLKSGIYNNRVIYFSLIFDGGNNNMEYFLSYRSGEKKEGNPDDPIANKGITHNCPFCGKQASKGRSLSWITSECIKKGNASFPCNSCGEIITISTKIFVENILEELAHKCFNPRIKQVSDFDLGNMIDQMKPNDLLVPNWGEVLDKWNKGILS
jgi:predicted RNA-binding Zn-ribbon protein involved in translation (DUF1610 family)